MSIPSLFRPDHRGENSVLLIQNCLFHLPPNNGHLIRVHLKITNYAILLIGATNNNINISVPLGHFYRLERIVDFLEHYPEFKRYIQTDQNLNFRARSDECGLFKLYNYHPAQDLEIIIPIKNSSSQSAKSTVPSDLENTPAPINHSNAKLLEDIFNKYSHPELELDDQSFLATFAFNFFDPNLKNIAENSETDELIETGLLDLEAEYERLLVNAKDLWKINKTYNRGFRKCAYLPEIICVPLEAEDSDLDMSSLIRRDKIIPTLAWIHPKTQVPLVRSSEPRISDPPQKNRQDIELIQQILKANPQYNKLFIFDCREECEAKEDRNLRHGGYETNEIYAPDVNDQIIENVFCNMPSSSTYQSSNSLKASLIDIMLVHRNSNTLNFFKKIHESTWLHRVRDLLYTVNQIIFQLETCNEACLIHCNSGRERTSVLTALAMICLDDYYRTIKGFQILIQKEFLNFGYDFMLEKPKNRSIDGSDGQDNQTISALFVLFMDAVFQLLSQFPAAFEFDERLLIEILYHINSNLFGTFLKITEKERTIKTFSDGTNKRNIAENTLSLWTMISNAEENYQNPSFFRGRYQNSVIVPNCNLRKLEVFSKYYGMDLVTFPEINDVAQLVEDREVIEENISQLEREIQQLSEQLKVS